MKTVVYESAEEIDAEQWSALAGDAEPRLDRPWFLSHVPETESAYVTVWRDGSLSALAPCLIWGDEDEWTTQRPGIVLLAPQGVRGPDEPGLDRGPLRRTAAELLSYRFAPSLAVLSMSSRFARVSDLLPADKASAERLLVEVDSLAASRGAALWAILGVAESSPLFEYAEELGFVSALLSANTVLHVPQSFDDYVAALPRGRRPSIRREVRAPLERGVEIAEEPDVPAIAPELNSVITAHRTHHGWPTPHAWPTDFSRLVRAYGNDMRIISARRNGRLLAFGMMFSRRSSHVTGYYADYSSFEAADFMFPNIAFYSVVKRVAALGGGTIQLGPTNYRAKLLRGCSLERVWGLYKPLDAGLREPLAAHIRELNRLQAAHFDALAAFQR